MYTKAIDFFCLFFTIDLIHDICHATNVYAWLHILDKQTYSSRDGSWDEVDCKEFYKYIGLLIYMGFVRVHSIDRYWSTSSLYHGLWARAFMSRDRFKGIQGMLHISDIIDKDDKLVKIRPLIEHMKSKCKELYQPKVNVSVDERMVKSKARSGMRQFMSQKPVRFGFKLWVIAESDTGYTIDFDVYTGKPKENETRTDGLAYEVVTTLCQSLEKRGYHVYFDNFFSSEKLVEKLLESGILSCGTKRTNRRGFPDVLKDDFSKAGRGLMRFIRNGQILILQWKDTRVLFDLVLFELVLFYRFLAILFYYMLTNMLSMDLLSSSML